MLLAFLLFGVAYTFRGRARFFESSLTAHAEAQLAARRAFLQLLEEIQQSMEIVLPAEGFTQPYLVLRDQRNRLVTLYLTKDPAVANTFRMIKVTSEGSREVVLDRISSCRFSGAGAGGVLLDLSSTVDGKEFSLITMVRLKAGTALDEL